MNSKNLLIFSPKNTLILVAILLIAGLALWGLLSNKSSYLTQTGVVEENLNTDLNSLDSTDLDSGTDAQLEQLSSDSSSF